MRNVFRIAAATIVCSALSAFAGANSHDGSITSSSGAHASSSVPSTPSAPTGVSPRLSGMPHYSGQMPAYRPTVTYHNGNRTLNYPAVGVSNVHHSVKSNAVVSNSNARIVHHSGGKLHADAGSRHSATNMQHTSGTLTRTENRNPGRLQHAGAINFNSRNRLDPQSSARLRNWHGNVSSNAEAQQKHWDNCHHHHNQDWWHNRCVVFIFWDWGWWGWWDGWWYPAWGYDPNSYYGYNEPIYGYADLSPEQIVAGVQSALQERGYYPYSIDGQMGPLTRNAIARYQRDRRLPITYGIDPATLGSLGIIH